MSDRVAAFNAALLKVTDERGSVYGHPKEDFARISGFWSVLFGIEVHPWQVPLAMDMVKTSRLMNSPDHLDSWTDKAGYARTGVMVTDPGE